ncbi:hypothetical protein [Nocardioides nematodiphilus]|uniref:hypothetical protein n=1 Tax=Nocardioides nematodiphilus TaxID=2849669 RepID=UPI001CD96D93|nr:hypothetical protein [Nocardioides nematodiphilus]MCA1984507.1 hypothetical protein [Nocardioides nematodiphilus]
MSTDEPGTTTTEPATDEPVATSDWWHRDHPTFAALSGFYAGLLFAILVPGLYAAILAAVVGQQRAEDLFPFVLVTLVVPLLLVLAPRSRRFGLYMWLGMISTAVVVVGVGGGVFWYMVSRG